MPNNQNPRDERRVFVITGAGQGLGRAYASMFGLRDQVVVAIDVNKEAVNSVAAEIAAAGGGVLADHC